MPDYFRKKNTYTEVLIGKVGILELKCLRN